VLWPGYNSCELRAWYLAEELGRPFVSKDFAVLKIAVFFPDVRRKHVDGFTETMFKPTTDGILLLIFLPTVKWLFTTSSMTLTVEAGVAVFPDSPSVWL
jgi:hypothetical protein